MTDGPNLKAIQLGTARRVGEQNIVVRLVTDDGKEQELAISVQSAASFVGRLVDALAFTTGK